MIRIYKDVAALLLACLFLVSFPLSLSSSAVGACLLLVLVISHHNQYILTSPNRVAVLLMLQTAHNSLLHALANVECIFRLLRLHRRLIRLHRSLLPCRRRLYIADAAMVLMVGSVVGR